ncbi:unnamed protein product [Polarella glacialis]|uniref:Uncharacterized protein n=1 Tax=Polarella glacialis TaxID=89957 RepID=A0A813FBF1_POLGL|nr:unnamed protein product [Polarella glacialis]
MTLLCGRWTPIARTWASIKVPSAGNRMLSSVAAHAGPLTSRMPSAGQALLFPVALAGLAMSMWPFFDLFALPWACRRAIEEPKFVGEEGGGQQTKAAVQKLTALLERRGAGCAQDAQGQIIVLCGTEARGLVRDLVRSNPGPCAHIDWGQHLVMNPYELVAFRFLGPLGELLNTYVKAAIFIGSILSQRHPRTDAILYTNNAINNFRRALFCFKASGTRPLLIMGNVDFLVCTRKVTSCKETQGLAELLLLTAAQQTLSLTQEGFADIILVLSDDPEVIEGSAFHSICKHGSVFDVRRVWGQIRIDRR